jgi:hypothetical protein
MENVPGENYAQFVYVNASKSKTDHMFGTMTEPFGIQYPSYISSLVERCATPENLTSMK